MKCLACRALRFVGVLIVVSVSVSAFSATWSVSNQWGSTSYLRIGDFNGDGKDDVASPSGGNVFLKLSTGNGFTSTTWNNPISSFSNYTWVGDFNGDGLADIANRVSGSQPGNISMRLSTGSGFTGQTWSVATTWGSGDYSFSGDFNGDGKTDIASAQGDNVYMKLSTGSSFTNETWSVSNQWGSAGYTFIGDFNGDNKDDIASFNGGTVYMKLSTGTGFTSTSWSSANSSLSNYTWIGDFNGDGYADIANRVSGSQAGTIYVRFSNGSDFYNGGNWNVSTSWGSAAFSKGGDFDGDGITDVASFSGSNAYMKFIKDSLPPKPVVSLFYSPIYQNVPNGVQIVAFDLSWTASNANYCNYK